MPIIDTRDAHIPSLVATPAPSQRPAADEDESPARATSFGTFKPVGHVMVGLPSRAALRGLKAELNAPGVPGHPADELTPSESIEEMEALIDGASPLAGFGYEITLMRRYLELARQGYSWLVVKADSNDDAAHVGELAKAHGATLAVHYGRLTVEDLI